jgi:hypothetical protein
MHITCKRKQRQGRGDGKRGEGTNERTNERDGVVTMVESWWLLLLCSWMSFVLVVVLVVHVDVDMVVAAVVVVTVVVVVVVAVAVFVLLVFVVAVLVVVVVVAVDAVEAVCCESLWWSLWWLSL